MLLEPLRDMSFDSPVALYSPKMVALNKVAVSANSYLTVNLPNRHYPKLVVDGLPGHRLDKFQQGVDSDTQKFARTIQEWGLKKQARSLQVTLFVPYTNQVGQNTQHQVIIVSKCLRMSTSQACNLLEMHYEIKMHRVNNAFYSKLYKIGEETPLLEGGFTNFDIQRTLYIGLTIGHAILYYTAPDQVVIEIFYTFTHRSGSSVTFTQTTSRLIGPVSIDSVYSLTQSTGPYRYTQVRYEPPTGQTENLIGMRVIHLTHGLGAHPSKDISTHTSPSYCYQCMLVGFHENKCLVMSHYRTIDSAELECVLDEDGRMLEYNSNIEIFESCEIPLNTKLCLVPKTNFSINLDSEKRHPLHYSSFAWLKYTGLTSEEKNFYHQFQSNLNENYLISCQYECTFNILKNSYLNCIYFLY